MRIVLEDDTPIEFGHMVGMLVVFDSDGHVLYISSEVKDNFLYGDDITGLNIKQLFPSFLGSTDNYDDLDAQLKREEEINAYRKNGTCFPVDLSYEKLGDGRYAFRITDRTRELEWKQRYERAEIDSKTALTRQNEFVANVTHELRTPVNGIKGNILFLREEGNLTSTQEETLNVVSKCCGNMEKIINDLLDFAKIDAGKISIEKEKFSFREMMQHVYDTHVKQAAQKGISFSINVDDSIPDEMYGDSLRIGQILNNFISNAVKFTSVGSVRVETVVSARTERNVELFFMVIDTGIGIARENIDKLFRSFSQVDGSITRTYGGTGLGLAISKQLVGMMNGSVRVDSEVGKGSAFAFSVVVGLTPEDDEAGQDSQDDESLDTNKTESIQSKFDQIINRFEREDVSELFEWGTAENRAEIKDTLSKLILCIEMDNWEKAETFAEKVKKLGEGSPEEFSKQLFRLKLAIRKGKKELAIQEYDKFLSIFNKE